MFRQYVQLRGVQTTLTTGATLTLSLQIAAPTDGSHIHITRITRSHHVSQSNDPVITLLNGAAPIWTARSQTPLKQAYAFPHPIQLSSNTLAEVKMTSSLAAHSLTMLVHYFLES